MNEQEENFLAAFSDDKTGNEPIQIRLLNYSTGGDYFSYAVDDSLKIYDARTGALRNIITAKIDTMCYFQKNTLLHSRDNMLFYLSIYDNTYLRSFESHKSKISSISVNDASDTFMSCSYESTKLWDIRYQDPILSFNSKGQLGALSRDNDFALADNNFVYIYDTRSPEHPRETKQLKPAFYRKMWYTHDSTCIGLSSFRTHMFLDENGDYLANFSLENDCDGCTINDSNIFLCGSSQNLMAYKVQDKKRIGRRLIEDFDVTVVRANPTLSQFIVGNDSSFKVFNRVM